MVHSLETGDTTIVVQVPNNPATGDAESFYGLAYDPKEKKMYFSSRHTIYRSNPDGTGIELAFSTIKCEFNFETQGKT